ncbi:MAG: TolC family protein [Nitrospinota bacterium]
MTSNRQTKTIKLVILMIVIVSFFPLNVRAETFDFYIDLLREHPAIESILENSKRYKELASAEMGLPDPVLILGVDNVPIADPSFNKFLPTSKVYGLQQKIPRHSLRRAKSDRQLALSNKQILIADYSLNKLKGYFITALYDYDKIKKLESFFKEQIKYYSELETSLRGRLESGKSVYGRLSEIDIKRTHIEQKLNDLQVEKRETEEEFINLVGEIPNIPLPDIKSNDYPKDIEDIYPVLISKTDLEAAEQSVKARKAAYGPSYGIQALYKEREAGENFTGDDWFSLQATITIPLWYYWNQRPKLKAANHEESYALYFYDSIKRLWTKKMKSLISERKFAKKNILLLENQKKSMERIISAAERSYESGGANLDSVLNARIDKLTIETELAMQYSRHIKLASEFNSHLIMRNENENNN